MQRLCLHRHTEEGSPLGLEKALGRPAWDLGGWGGDRRPSLEVLAPRRGNVKCRLNGYEPCGVMFGTRQNLGLHNMVDVPKASTMFTPMWLISDYLLIHTLYYVLYYVLLLCFTSIKK